jgi:hypothetical protein
MAKNGHGYADFDELASRVNRGGERLLVTMEELRDLHGKGRLGPRVNDEISQQLRGVGLGHAPDPLPTKQHDTVVIFRFGSKIDRVFNALKKPDSSALSVLDRLLK